VTIELGEELYVIAGLTRLTVPVAEGLVRAGGRVVVIATTPDPPTEELLAGRASVVHATGGREAAFRGVDLPSARCLLALAEDDLENVQTTVMAHKVAPDVPVVIRLFDGLLADQMERLAAVPGRGINVRRAYSMSALAASQFVASALGDEPALTMRFADGEIPFLRVVVRDRSPLIGTSLQTVEREFGCAVVAQRPIDGARWVAANGADRTFVAGDEVVIGGRQHDVLRLAVRNSELFNVGPRARQWRRRRRRHGVPASAPRRVRNITLLPRIALVLTAVMVASMLFVTLGLHHTSVVAFYWTLTAAASGSPTNDVPTQSTALKIFSVVPVVVGGALLGVLFSYLASIATAERLEQRMGRRASRLRGHVVLGGLGTVGYRVEGLLWRLGIPTAVLELRPDEEFINAVQAHTPVVSGDVRLADNLERVNIAEAACLIALTDNDLSNVEACLNAQALRPGIRTVARIFDEEIAESATSVFGIDASSSAVRVAARAFVDAAIDERAMRQFQVGDADFLGLRLHVTSPLTSEDVQRWRTGGARLVAFRRGDGDALPASALVGPLHVGDSAIVAGPAAFVRSLVTEDAEGGQGTMSHGSGNMAAPCASPPGTSTR
jgi:Trk K+ transport system NAD-binding subunit